MTYWLVLLSKLLEFNVICRVPKAKKSTKMCTKLNIFGHHPCLSWKFFSHTKIIFPTRSYYFTSLPMRLDSL